MAKDIVLGKTRINWARDVLSGEEAKVPSKKEEPKREEPKRIARKAKPSRSSGIVIPESELRAALEGEFVGDEERAMAEAGSLERAATSRTCGLLPGFSRGRSAPRKIAPEQMAKIRQRLGRGGLRKPFRMRGAFVGAASPLRDKVMRHVAPENRAKASKESDAKLRETVAKMQDGLAKLAAALKGRTPIPIAKTDYDRYASMARSGNMPAATYVEVMERFIGSGKVKLDPAGLTGTETKELVQTGKLPPRLKAA